MVLPHLRSQAFLASLVGRLPIGALGLLLILRTREVTGSYAAGGVVAGVNALAMGVGAPVLGRLIDRRGQAPVIALSGVAFAAAIIGFALLPAGAGLGWAIALAAVAGAAYPPVGPALRANWTADIADADARHATFTIESVIFELVYILGPLLFVSVIGAGSLSLAVAATGIFGLLGAIGFAAAPPVRRRRPRRESADPLGALRGHGVRVLVGVFCLFGVTVAGIEMGVVAFTEERHARGALPLVLATWGLGSLAGGVVAARRSAPEDPARRLAILFAGLAAGSLPLVLASSTVALGALIVASGLFIAPALSLAFATLGQLAPAGTVTEAYTWAATGIAAGAAGGSALAGLAVEYGGPTEAFLLGALAALAAGVVARAIGAAPPAALRPAD